MIIITTFFTAILWLAVAYIVFANFSVNAAFNLAPIYTGNISLGILILISVLVGAGIAGLESIAVVARLKEKNKNYRMEYEKSSLKTVENNDKVKILESKIEVLEKALKDALNK